MIRNLGGQVIGAQMRSATDGSAFTSTVSVSVTVDGGTQGAGGGTVTHEGNGYHTYTPTQAETDGALVAFTFTGTGALPVTIQVEPDPTILRRGTAQAGGASSITLDAGASATNDFYNGCAVLVIDGTGAGQIRTISDYVGSTKVATVDNAWATQPDATSVFELYAVSPAPTAMDANVIQWRGTQPNTLQSGRVDGHMGSVADNVLTAAKFAAGAFDAVWSVAARTLTAGTNIVLAKGVGVTGFNDLSAAQVNAEMVDALTTDAYAEPGQETPAATTSIERKLSYLYKYLINEREQDGTELRLKNAAGTVVDQQATVADAGGVFTRGKLLTGP